MKMNKCNRGNCSHIMCDRYSIRYGYICSDCFSELIKSNLSIRDFMETDPGDSLEKKDRYEDLNLEFKRPDLALR